MKAEKIRIELLDRLSGSLGKAIKNSIYEDKELLNSLREIRIRTGQTISLTEARKKIQVKYIPTQEEIRQLITALCNNSVYAYEKNIKEGFITIKGGHRIGLAGRYVDEKGILSFGSINIRVAGEIKGAGNKILPMISDSEGFVYNTLIVSPPGCGKTTLLRDLARNLSCKGFNVGVVDERSEIAACFMGVPSNDLGPSCDIYDACPKNIGIYMMLRAMSPEIIVTDEIGSQEDIVALEKAITSGIKIIASCHGKNEKDIKAKKLDSMFERVVFLSSINGPGTIERIVKYDLHN